LLGIVDENFLATQDGGTAGLGVRALEDVPAPAPQEPPVVEPEHEEAAEDGGLPDPHVADAILASMTRKRGAEMRDIVATIEERQYELISAPLEQLLVIQGGPGTGKTAIALHRAAWLIYRHKDELERAGVLVVGPNRAFMEYVSQVLPSLGETSVTQLSIDRVVNLSDVRVRGSESDAVARLKGEIRMARVIQRTVMDRVRTPDEDVDVNFESLRVAVPHGAIGAEIVRAWRETRTYLSARDQFRRGLVALVQEHARGSRLRLRSGPSAEDVDRAVAADGGLLDRIWPTVTAPEVVRDLLNSRQRLASAGTGLTESERSMLQRDRSRLIREEPWTAADIPLLDEADVLIRGITSSFGYVIVDESQDLSPMQIRMVLRRSGQGWATFVGDIAQATSPSRFGSWEELLQAAELETEPAIAELAISYRVPRQIMDLAAGLLPRIAPDLIVPRAVRDGVEQPRLLASDEDGLGTAIVKEVEGRAELGGSTAVITAAQELGQVQSLLAQAGVQAGDILKDGLSRDITVLTAVQAKGLEFDHVVVIEPGRIAGDDGHWALAYIALTRPTRTLSVLYTTDDPFQIPAQPEPEPEMLPAEPATLPEVPPQVETGPVLGPRYTEALMQAKFLHAGQRRRGTTVPYLAHLQSVSALVLEDGGGEDEAIAALLHDAVEREGEAHLYRILEQFGPEVARIVAGCSTPERDEHTSWHDSKVQYLLSLESAGAQVRRVALAEALDNARAILRDYRRTGAQLWQQMNVDHNEVCWYQSELADLFVTERPGDMASELRDTVERLLELVSAPEPAAPV
ncbi:hypothetical protein AYO39_03475, partial [Actinobacteria bacterium SCGC AG-212-D09]